MLFPLTRKCALENDRANPLSRSLASWHLWCLCLILAFADFVMHSWLKLNKMTALGSRSELCVTAGAAIAPRSYARAMTPAPDSITLVPRRSRDQGDKVQKSKCRSLV